MSVVIAARADGWPVCRLLASSDWYSNSCYRWLKFEEDVEDGGERWSKPYVATLSLHSLFELRSCIINNTGRAANSYAWGPEIHANNTDNSRCTCFFSH